MIHKRLLPHLTATSIASVMIGLGTLAGFGTAVPVVSQTVSPTPTPTPTATSTGSTSVTTMDVNATVSNACTVSTAAINFGTVDVTLAGQQDSPGSLDVTCTSGATWSAAADAGLGSGATLTTRKLHSTVGNTVLYHLFTTSAGTTEWGNGTLSTAAITGTGTGAVDHRAILGRVFRNQVVPAGAYTDRITVTVSY